MLNPRIIRFAGVRLLGLQDVTAFNSDSTPRLWARFRSGIHIPYRSRFGDELYSVSSYPPGFHAAFDPDREFRKWAAAVYLGDEAPPGGAEWLDIPAGQYAVFRYVGRASGGAQFFASIFTQWLPQSGFRLDFRPHFEILPPNYDPQDPTSQEDVYIPVVPLGT